MRLIAEVCIWLIAICVVAYFSMIILATAKVEAQGTFDHNQCQYPARPTNPIDGCDNSDPSMPEAVVKGEAETPMSQNIVTEGK